MEQAGWECEISPYHSGEQNHQDQMGRLDYQDRMARKIHRPYMPDQHQEFYAQLPMFMAGSVDPDG